MAWGPGGAGIEVGASWALCADVLRPGLYEQWGPHNGSSVAMDASSALSRPQFPHLYIGRGSETPHCRRPGAPTPQLSSGLRSLPSPRCQARPPGTQTSALAPSLAPNSTGGKVIRAAPLGH